MKMKSKGKEKKMNISDYFAIYEPFNRLVLIDQSRKYHNIP